LTRRAANSFQPGDNVPLDDALGAAGMFAALTAANVPNRLAQAIEWGVIRAEIVNERPVMANLAATFPTARLTSPAAPPS